MTTSQTIMICFCFLLFSCGSEKKKTKVEIYAKPLDWTIKYKNTDTSHKSKQEQTKDRPNPELKTQIEYSDIASVLQLIEKEKLIDKKIKIDTSFIPEFCYLSPTAMLGEYNKDISSTKRPSTDKILDTDDIEFMLAQPHGWFSKGFNWKNLTNRTCSEDTYPKYCLSLPVFSIDKTKFVICIEKYSSKDCFDGTSYLIEYKNGKISKRIRFDHVNGC